MKYPFLALALLETSGFTNHQRLMLPFDFYFRGVANSSRIISIPDML